MVPKSFNPEHKLSHSRSGAVTGHLRISTEVKWDAIPIKVPAKPRLHVTLGNVRACKDVSRGAVAERVVLPEKYISIKTEIYYLWYGVRAT